MLNTLNHAMNMSQNMPAIDIIEQAGDWPREAEMNDLAAKAISVTVDVAGLNLLQDSELSIVLSNNEQVQILNQTWRKIAKPTNVLSFPVEDIAIGEMPGHLLGDIVLARETIAKEANDFDISFNHHLTHLIIHGFLHIFGYDHIEDKDAEVMETLEISCLGRLGIENPYFPSTV